MRIIKKGARSYEKSKLDNNHSKNIDIKIMLLKPAISTITAWQNEIPNYLQFLKAGTETDIVIWWTNYSNVDTIFSEMAGDILC